MKRISISCLIVIAFILVSSCCTTAWSGELKVGVCSKVHNEFLTVLSSQAQIKAQLIEKLSAKSLSKFDVVTWTLGRLSSNKEERRLLRKYVKAGGGLILTRDPEYAFSNAMKDNPPFPEVAGLLPRIWRYDRSVLYRVVDPDHLLGKVLPGQVEMQTYDHLILDPGPNGTILMLSEDADTVMVAGNIDKGRVVIIGYSPGYKKTSEKSACSPEECLILNMCIRWAGRYPLSAGVSAK